MPSPQKTAYLRYLGLKKVETLSEDEADRRIQILHKKANGFCGRKLRAKMGAWHFQKLVLHPDLFRTDLLRHLLSDEAKYRSFVRTRHVSCTGTLSAAKIEKVLNLLLDEHPGWWLNPNDSAIFYQRLAREFPECVDGPPPQKTKAVAKSGKGGGCLVLAGFVGFSGIATLGLLIVYGFVLP